MGFIETSYLFEIATKENIVIEEWDFPKPIDAIYFFEHGLPPSIGISRRINYDSPLYRCILAEELGHHFTTSGECISRQRMSYKERLHIGKVEYKAVKWAAETLMPYQYLKKAIVWECYWTNYGIAEYFGVTIDMVKFRLQLDDVQDLISYTKAKIYG